MQRRYLEPYYSANALDHSTRDELLAIRERIAAEARRLEAQAFDAVAAALNAARSLALEAGGNFDSMARIEPASLEQRALFHIGYLISRETEEIWNNAASLRGTIDAIDARLNDDD